MTNLKLARTFATFVALASITQPLMAATTVSGYITTNTTWTTANSPYVVSCVLEVSSGATLTIDPGVVVKFAAYNCKLAVYGAIVAEGTAQAPIVFTSYKDDSVGGDTNGDGSATSPAAGDWWAVEMWGATGSFDYTEFMYGGYGSSNYAYGALWVYGGTATVDHSRFSTNQSSGISLHSNATVHVSHTEVDHNGNGISVLNAYLDLKLNSNVHDNSDSGIWINSIGYTGTATSVSRSDVKNNGSFGVYLQVFPGDPLPGGNYNNIYDNNTSPGSSSNGRQLYSYYSPGPADWTLNYWGSGVASAPHTCSFNSSLKHVYWATTYSECVLPASGPTSYLLHLQSDNTCPVTNTRYCAADNMNNLSYSTTYINNSGY